MKTPNKVHTIQLIAQCNEISVTDWEKYMKGTKKANGKTIRNLIKKHLPTLYQELCLDVHNPYEHHSVKKEGLLVYVHSGIEYFLKIS